MEKFKNTTNLYYVFLGSVVLIIIGFTFIPVIIKNKQSIEIAKHEYNLITEEKTISANEVVEDFALLLSNKKYDEASRYLSDDCKLIDSKNKERVKLEYCLEKLNIHSSHRIEKRGNSLQDQETYRILWNGTSYENTNQIITVYLKKKIEKDIRTYEIFRVILTDNTLSY